MYKVLIVDDEPWVVKSLQMAIDWTALGFEVIGSASHGKEALARIEELVPNLVITDIRMPVMSGLELMEHALERWPQLQFVIISGHAEFEYARKAIDYGAAGYCLKPADPQEMAKVLKKVKSRIEMQQPREPDIQLLVDETRSPEEIISLLSKMGLCWDDGGMKVVCGPLPDRIALNKMADLFLVNKSEPPLPYPQTGEQSWGISADVESPLRLNEAILEAQIAQKQYFMTGKPGVYSYVTCLRARARTALHPRILVVAAAAAEKNIKGIQYELDGILVELLSNGYNIKHANYCYIRLSDVLDMHQSDEQDYELESYRELLQSFADVREMIGFFQDQFSKQWDLPPAPSSANSIIRDILAYINENYAEEVSLANLAKQFHLNPSYLCRVFKRECGKTLSGYLVELRLNKACQMLRNTRLLVNRIAEQCGYGDYFYFERLFKRTYGITPTQYREGMPIKAPL